MEDNGLSEFLVGRWILDMVFHLEYLQDSNDLLGKDNLKKCKQEVL